MANKNINDIIREIRGKMDAVGGLKNICFVACGGSQAAIYAGKYLLDCEAKNIPVEIYNSNEFVHMARDGVDGRSLVIACSLKATAETVEAVRMANAKNAITIAMTGSDETGMAKAGQYVVTYSSGDNQVYSQSNQSQVLRLCFEILRQFEGWEKYDRAFSAFDSIDGIIDDCRRKMLPAAKNFAETYKDDEVFQVIGSGPLYGTAYTMANCHFMEMQCRHAVTIHSGEYFHGPFETTDKSLAMVLLMSTGKTRPLDERVLRFLKIYAGRYFVIDAKDTGVEAAMDASVAEYFNPVIMIPLERFFVSQIAEVRGHSMDFRRYMWKTDY